MDPTIIHCDSQSCVKLLENPVFHDKSKHIEIKYHYIRDMVQRKTIHVQYLSTHEQIADIFTKPLAKTKFVYFRKKPDLMKIASLAERECWWMQLCETFYNLQTCEVWIIVAMWSLSLNLQTWEKSPMKGSWFQLGTELGT